MTEPMPPKRRVSLTEILTVDDLINLVSSKAHTRRGRIVVGASSLVLLAAIIFAPIMIRSNHGGADTTPTLPVVTVPPSTNARTAFVTPLIPLDTAINNDRNRYGVKPDTATTVPAPKTTAAPPVTVAPPVTTPATFPAQSPPPTFPPPTFPPPTFPPATNPPPVTSPPLTIPPGGVITPGG